MTIAEDVDAQRAEDDAAARALFEEARRRRRRRRGLVVGTVVLAALAAVLGVRLAGGGRNGSGGGRASSKGHPAPAAAADQSPTGARGSTAVVLPAGDWFNEVTTVGHHLVLTGREASTGAGAAASSTGRCVAASVNPRTLALGPLQRGVCDDPGLWGRTVEMVTTYLRGSDDATIRVARVDPATGAVTTGPVVMTYEPASDTGPVSIDGGGWLWIYDVASTDGPEVLQVSPSTGQVVDTVTLPALYRPVLAADDDGLWLGNSVGGNAMPRTLWHVAPGARSAVGAGPGGSQYVFWLDAAGDHLWAGIGPPGNLAQTIWRFDGPAATVVFHAPDHGYDPVGGVVGDETQGLWAVVASPPITGRVVRSPSGTWTAPGQNERQDVVRIAPDTGAEKVVATLKRLPVLEAETGTVTGQSTVLGGSLYILQPPFRADGYLGYSTLVRVRT